MDIKLLASALISYFESIKNSILALSDELLALSHFIKPQSFISLLLPFIMFKAFSTNTAQFFRPSEDAHPQERSAPDEPLPSTSNEEDPLQTLQSPEQAELLNAMDNVRALGVGYEIPLPQLIVVGDQSSGKSSVLEAISRVEFPVDDGTCTRFPTEVILRRSEETSFSVKIRPGPNQTQEHIQALEQFHAEGTKLEDARDLIQQARDHMGLASGGFTRDVLCLNVSGPLCPHLTLVDLPGIIHNPSPGRTIEDKRLVSDLVQDYMSQPRSIILAVVPSGSDASTQEILYLVKTHDEDGQRTMGIITKTDLSSKSNPNAQKLDLARARGEEDPFRLGWHLLRNAGSEERGSPGFDRDVTERKFFSSSPWNQLMPEKKGIKNLRSRLSTCLLDLIRAEMPAVVQEIEAAKTSNDDALEKLGELRTTATKQREYLTKIGEIYQRLVRDAASAHYTDDFFGSSDEQRRLRTMVRRGGSSFHQIMHMKGHTYDICWENPKGVFNSAPSFRNSELMELIRTTLETTRGWELPGSFDPLLISPIFKQMSSKWIGMAQTHAEGVWQLSKRFLEILLSKYCDMDTCTKIFNEVIDHDLEERRKRVRSKIEELATPYTKGHVFTYNRRFEDLQRSLHEELGLDTAGARWTLFEHNDDLLACEQVFVRAQAFYQIALDMFIDNVTMIAVENCLISGLEDILSPGRVAGMKDKELTAIASESSENVEKRAFLRKLQKNLTSALDTCKKHEKFATIRRREDHKSSRGDPVRQSTVETSLSSLTLNSTDKREQMATQTVLNPHRADNTKLELPITPSRSASSVSTSPSTTNESTKPRSSSASTITSPPDSAGHPNSSVPVDPLKWSERKLKKRSDAAALSSTPASRAIRQVDGIGSSLGDGGHRYREVKSYDEDGTFHPFDYLLKSIR